MYGAPRGAPVWSDGPHLEGAAGGALAEPRHAVQVVGGHRLVLLLDEAEGGEEEARRLAVAVLHHGGQRVDGAPAGHGWLIRRMILILIIII